MIPKIIHYCWFGRNPLPKSAKKCIASWKKYLPDYEIKEWNEDNFDVNIIPYTHDAYEAKKYAFVSDYARFWILYYFGGVYFDTDVEVLRSMDDIIARGAFMGVEKGAYLLSYRKEKIPAVAPGLGIGAESFLDIYKEIIDYYKELNFIDDITKQIAGTVVTHTTRVLQQHGMPSNLSSPISIAGVWIYPSDFFCPMDSTTGIISITDNTVSIHHYDCSWMNQNTFRFKMHLIKNSVNRLLGTRFAEWLNKLMMCIK